MLLHPWMVGLIFTAVAIFTLISFIRMAIAAERTPSTRHGRARRQKRIARNAVGVIVGVFVMLMLAAAAPEDFCENQISQIEQWLSYKPARR